MTKEVLREKMQRYTFTLDEEPIYKLSLIYNELAMRYESVAIRILSNKAEYAKQSKEWIHFKRLHILLLDISVDAYEYLNILFKSFPKANIKNVKRLPTHILYGKWALSTYERYIKSLKERHIEEENNEYEIYKKQLIYSLSEVKKQKDYLTYLFPEIDIPNINCILSLSETLPPIFLAFCPEYLEKVKDKRLCIKKGVFNIIKRMNRDKIFFNKVSTMLETLSL